MVENNEIFQNKVKKSFLKVKEDINYLKNEIKTIKEDISIKFREIDAKIDRIIQNIPEMIKNDQNQTNPKKVPQEIKGSISTQRQLNVNSTSTQPSPDDSVPPTQHIPNNRLTLIFPYNAPTKELTERLMALTKTEVLIYLTIFQLEDEENTRPTYAALSKKLKISPNTLKSHISHIFKKGIPLLRNVINNRLVSFHLPKDLKRSEFKKELTSIYYAKEPLYKNIA